MKLIVNGIEREWNGDPDMPLLWFLRDIVDLKGTKYGCGIASCGACMVHVDGEALQSCSIPMQAVDGASVTTIEGLSDDVDHPVQQAWAAQNVPQCGYCQSGQMMQAAKLLQDIPNPGDEDIDSYMQGNICRCGTYPRIRAAIKEAARLMAEGDGS